MKGVRLWCEGHTKVAFRSHSFLVGKVCVQENVVVWCYSTLRVSEYTFCVEKTKNALAECDF